MEEKLWTSVMALQPLKPRFVSVTYGAGGTTRERTHATLKRIRDETSLEPAAHLTCVGSTKAEIDEIARNYWDSGIRHIVALRGDAPQNSDNGGGAYIPHPDGYAYASDLVLGLKKIADFEISVAAYPETHPEAANFEADLDNLKRKLDAGANRAITQYFFDVEHYLRFMDKVLAAGISTPVVPGILPVTNFSQVTRFSKMCGASVPGWMAHLFEGVDDDPDMRMLLAAVVAAEQVRLLYAHGVREFHFYTLNRSELTSAICHLLGFRRTVL
jgi:methylenetetrahydrofolate reductase (NADPH)